MWEHKVGKGSALGGIEWGSAADEQNGYFATADAQPAPKAGGLAALGLATGERGVANARPPAVECKPGDRNCCVQAQSAAISVIPGVVFSGATNGMMRAYCDSRRQGALGIQHRPRRTRRSTASRRKADRLNGPGPVVAGGMLFMNSGYAYLGFGAAGNVLLAFGVE